MGDTVKGSFAEQGAELMFEQFNGECSQQEIDRLQAICQSAGVDVLIGIGGGKTLDTAKAVSHFAKIPVIIVPTIASTDAPTSALSVIYTPEGEFSSYLFLPKNPDMVMMDSKIIAGAPVRLLVAGMGDALSTYFEARANRTSGRATMAGVVQPRRHCPGGLCYRLCWPMAQAGLAVGEQCLHQGGGEYYRGQHLPERYRFWSSDWLAHAIHNGFTRLEGAITTSTVRRWPTVLTQLVLDNAPLEEIETVINFVALWSASDAGRDGYQGDQQGAPDAGGRRGLCEGETIQHAVPGDPGGCAGGTAVDQLGRR